jgi:hypothetical protein
VSDLTDRLGALDLDFPLDDGDLLVSAVVVMSVLEDGDSRPRLCIATNESMSWIEQAGLLRLAERICSEPPDADDEG